jgi:putative ABC transport system permease protein
VTLAVIAQDLGLFSKFNIFIPNQALRKLYDINEDATGALLLYLKDMRAIPEVQARLRTEFEKAGYGVMENNPKAFWMKFEVVNREDWTGQKLDLTTWEDEISFIKWTVTALNGLSGILTFVLLVIIAIGIMNTLWIAIRERTREIGTLRAIGMQRRYVLWMFVVEAFCLGLIGTLAGAVMGTLFCGLINLMEISVPLAVQLILMSDKLKLAVAPTSVLGAIALITFCTTAISLIPSFLAARLKPITAMHHLG